MRALSAYALGVLAAMTSIATAQRVREPIALPVWIAPVAAPHATIRPCQYLGLLSLPAAWSPGDGGVVLLVDRQARTQARESLTQALLDHGAAVMEFGLTDDCSPDDDRPPVGDALGRVLGGLVALADRGAGVVVALGEGRAGSAALGAADPGLAAPYLAPQLPRFALGMAFGAGPPRFAAGSSPATTERWTERLELFCTMTGPALAPGDAAGAAAVARSCRAATSGLQAGAGRPGPQR